MVAQGEFKCKSSGALKCQACTGSSRSPRHPAPERGVWPSAFDLANAGACVLRCAPFARPFPTSCRRSDQPCQPSFAKHCRPRTEKSVTPLLCLSLAGILWGAGGLVGVLLGRVSGATPLSVAAFRLLAGGGLLVAFHSRPGSAGARRAAWTRSPSPVLSAGFQAAVLSPR